MPIQALQRCRLCHPTCCRRPLEAAISFTRCVCCSLESLLTLTFEANNGEEGSPYKLYFCDSGASKICVRGNL